jgi:hypothetical protein
MRQSFGIAALCSLVVGCALPIQLPPPAEPARVMPALSAPAPEPGQGQVAIDADEPSTVERYTGDTTYIDTDGNMQTAAVYAPVCSATPCVTTLAFGDNALRLTSNLDPNHSGIGTVSVAEQPTDYRFALGHNDISPHFVSGLFTVVGGATVAMSGLFAYAFTQKQSEGLAPQGAWGVGGLVALGVGTAITALGAYLLGDPGHAQAGTAVQWTP